MSEYKTILAATDLSDPALAAVHHAGALAKELGSKVILTYVMEDRLPKFLSDKEISEIGDRHREHAEQSLRECIAEHMAGVDVEPVVLSGQPHEEIGKLAKECDASLLVIGMHGHGFLKHALVGSVAERLLHDAHCPVVVVPRTKG